MARVPQQQQGGVGAAQRAAANFLVFSGIDKINTRVSREVLPDHEAAWIEIAALRRLAEGHVQSDWPSASRGC